MQARGIEVERARITPEGARRNEAFIREKPDLVLATITSEKAVFDERDVARACIAISAIQSRRGFRMRSPP